MEGKTVSLSGATGQVPVALPTGRPAAASPESAPPPPVERPAQSADGQFLASLAGQESAGGLRQTFARFVVDPTTHEIAVHIVDATSQEVIRSIPGDELRRLAHQFRASQGLVLNSVA